MRFPEKHAARLRDDLGFETFRVPVTSAPAELAVTLVPVRDMAKETRADLWVIPGAGHMDLPMRYEELSERVFEWLDAVLSEDSAAVTRGTREVSPDVSS